MNLIKNSMVPYFSKDKDFNLYYQKVMEDFNNVKSFFPKLKISGLFFSIPRELFIYGNLIPFQILSECKTEKDIKRKSLYIFATYPHDFPNRELYIEDLHEKIDWSQIPYKHHHKNIHPENKRVILCTHHPAEEIRDYPIESRSIVVLSSAWKLYIQYKEYLKTGTWTLKDLPHNYNLYKLGRLKKQDIHTSPSLPNVFGRLR